MGIPSGAQSGIDVSNYQRAVNWFSVFDAGYMFAFVKVSEGANGSDNYFAGN